MFEDLPSVAERPTAFAALQAGRGPMALPCDRQTGTPKGVTQKKGENGNNIGRSIIGI